MNIDGQTSRNIIISSDINGDSALKVIEQILDINEEDNRKTKQLVNYVREPIRIYINSSGGYIRDGFSIISIIENSLTPVYTICLGKAYSMGLVILMSGHRRFAMIHSSAMMHDLSSGAFGTGEDIKEQVEEIKKLQDYLFNYISKRTKITKEMITRAKKNKQDIYFNLTEMVKYGIVEGKLEGII